MSSSQEPPPNMVETTQHAPTTAPLTMPPGQMNLPAGYQTYAYPMPAPMPYIPYEGQQAFEAPRPAPNKAWEITKMVLQTLSIILAVVGIGLGFSTLNFFYFAYTVVIAAAPPCILAFVWSLTEMIVRITRKFRSGIHPGAHIALSLIIFLVGVVLTSLFGPWFQNSWNGEPDSSSESCSYQYNDSTESYVYVCNNSTSDDEAAERQFNHEQSIAYAAAVVTYIIAAIHFALFVGACVDTSKVNAAASRPIYVIAQPQGIQNMMQGWQPIQQEAPVQAPIQTTARDVPPTEDEDQTTNVSKGKGKEPIRSGDIVEHYAPSGSQA